MRLRHLAMLGLPAAALASIATVGTSTGTTPTDDAARLRCATRLSIAFTGKAPDAALSTNPDPQSAIDTLMADPAFIEQFARFANANMNTEPADTAMPEQDAAYWLAKYVLTNNKPWHEMFDGQYDVQPDTTTTPKSAKVVVDTNGLGYFRSYAWMSRYAGNEEQGYRLSAAFRIQQNIIGLDVGAVTNAPGTDISATGRMSSACSSCHYDPYFALDKVAKILSKKDITSTTPIKFIAPTEGPQTIEGGVLIHNDKELVQTLVASDQHKFRTCRLAFEFLYGRPEANCEAPLFDACVDAYTQTNDVRAALRTIAQDPGFCE